MDNYKIRAVLQGHSADVKQVAASLTSDGSLVSASRDKTARLWQPMDDNTYTLRNSFYIFTKTKEVYQRHRNPFGR